MDITERQGQVAKEIADLQGKLAKLKAEQYGLAQPYPMPLQKLAVRLHEIGCHFDHTEGCGWHYDNKKPFALARGRVRRAQNIKNAEAAGYTVARINELLDALPEGDVAPAGERKRNPSLDERELCTQMYKAFTMHFEGSMHWGRGWERTDGSWHATHRWSQEEKTKMPWNGLQHRKHRKYMAAARAWAKTTGLDATELASFTNLIGDGRGWGC